MRKVYDLREDRRIIELIQDATLNTEDYGILSDHGLVGSDDWWRAIERGELPVHSVEGIITNVYMAGHNDWPEFEVDGGNGKIQWERLGDDSEYVVGKPVRVEYVAARPKPRWATTKDIKLGLDKAIIVISIWVG